MRTYPVAAMAAIAMLGGCSGPPASAPAEEAAAEAAAPEAEFGFYEAMEQPSLVEGLTPPDGAEEAAPVMAYAVAEETKEPDGEMPVGMPQIAYAYDYGFRVDSEILGKVQQQHADMCVGKGPSVCRIISMRQSDASGEYGFARLEIEVIANQARDFGKDLVGTTEKAGGELNSSSVTGEDLSKQIVDTEARLRARRLLRDRLMEVLATRRGTVAELVEAERGVAQVNEEIDQAASWLAEMKGRVAFSDITIDYETEARSAGGFWEPIRWAFGSMGGTLGRTIATLIMFVTAILPWVLVIAAAVWGWRKAGLPTWRWRRNKAEAETSEGEAEA